MGLNIIDKQICDFYVSRLLAPLKYAENGVYFWFPGSGKTTIVENIFTNRQLWNSYLSGMSSKFKVYRFWGHLAEGDSLQQLLDTNDFKSYGELEAEAKNLLSKGKELVCVIGRIDSFPDTEKLKIFKTFIKLNSINKGRIHILLHLIDKPWFEETLTKHPDLLALASRIEILPIIPKSLVKQFISSKATDYDFAVDKNTFTHITTTYGGIIQLTKEYLRSHGRNSTIELKLNLIWQKVPTLYKKYFEYKELKKGQNHDKQIVNDLKEFGVADLAFFSKYTKSLLSDPTLIIPKLLTKQELKLWKYITKHPGELIDKNNVIRILRPNNTQNISLWALDQAVSRFRKKLIRANIDPTQLKTVKGKGYVWER